MVFRLKSYKEIQLFMPSLVQIIVYTGAIMILFLFVLMLVGRETTCS